MTLRLGFLTVANLGVQFLLTWSPMIILGAGRTTDLLFGALVLPQVVAAILAAGVIQVLIPVLVEQPTAKRSEIVHGLVFWYGCLVAVLVAALFLLSPLLSSLLYGAFDREEILLVTQMMRISLVGSFFCILTAVYSAHFYVGRRAVQLESFGLIGGLVGLPLMILFLSDQAVALAVWFVNVRWFVYFALLMIFCGAGRVRLSCGEPLRKSLQRLRILLLGSAIYKTDIFFDRHFSARSDVGDLTMLHIVQQVYSAALSLLNRAVVSPLSPQLASLHRKGLAVESNNLVSLLSRRLLTFNLAFLALLCAAYCVSFWIVNVQIAGILLRSWLQSALLTSGVLVFGSLGMLLTNRYYSQGNTLTPSLIGVIGFSFGILLKFVGFELYQFDGLLVAISCYYLVNGLVYFILFKIEKSRLESSREIH